MGDKIYNIENITNAQFVIQSLDYQKLVEAIAKQQKRIERLQRAGDTEGALEESAELETLEKQLADFKENVLRLYEIFNRIDIDTERLAQAKACFDQGQFREADAILNAEEMGQDLARLQAREQQIDQEKAAIAKSKTQIADEFLIKARLQTLTYDHTDWFDHARQYFETSLTAARTLTSLFEYAVFLQNHNCFDDAKSLYSECLGQNLALAEENPRTYCLPGVAGALNNLANLQKAQNDFPTAQANYEEALRIRRVLATENPRTYLPDVAMTLNNLANLQTAQNDIPTAQANYEEALRIRRALAEENPRTYLPDVATTLNNLAILQKAQNNLTLAKDNYQEALRIYRALAVENPSAYLPDVAMTLNNLANLHTAQNDFPIAQASYEEALRIYRALAVENPSTYLPDVAMTLINFSIFYLQAKTNKDRSIALAIEVLQIAQDFQQVPRVMQDAAKAVQVLRTNGVNLSQLQE